MAYLVEINVVYGLSLVLMGAAALQQPGDDEQRQISRHFWLLGLFGLLHGGKKLFDAWALGTGSDGTAIAWAGALLLFVSYLPLFEFARRAMADPDASSDREQPKPPPAWVYLPLCTVIGLIAAVASDPAAALTAMSGYLLGFPGALAAGLMLGRAFGTKGIAARVLAAAFIAYAVFGGLIVADGPSVPTWVPTEAAFLDAAGVPLQALQAICAFSIMLALSNLVRGSAETIVKQARARTAEIEELANMLEQRVEERNAALHASEARLREAERIGRIGSWQLDIGNDRITWSDETFRIFEIDPAQFEASNAAFLRAVHPDDRGMVDKAYRESLTDRRPCNITYRLQLPDGGIKWVHERGETEFTANGSPLISLGTVQDITERKLAEEAIRESEERLRQAAELAGLGHWVWDAVTDRCSYCSEENARIHGISVQDYMDKAASLDSEFSFVHPDDHDAVKAHFVALRNGKSFDIEYRMVTPRNEIRIIREMAKPVFDDEGKVVREHGSVLDLTEIRRTEDQLRQSQKMEAVGQLTGGVAHDFNNLLATIVGNLELLEERLEAADTRRGLVETAIRAAERGANLTQRLLAFSRKQALHPEPLSVRTLIAGMLEMLQRTLGETISIEVVDDSQLWLTQIDPTQLESAILNLAINARDAMPDGGKLTIEQRNVTLSEDDAAALADVEPGHYVLISITDTGSGMRPEVREHAIEPFFTTKEVGKGTGLGLSMVFGFVKQSGGNVTIESEAEEGTTVKLYLQRHTGARLAIDEPAPSDQSMPAEDELILLVEDDADLRSLMVHLLHSLGYRVLQAGTGDDALQTLQENPEIDLLVTDVVLPGGMGGVKLAKQARAQRNGLPVLYMSGYTENPTVADERLDQDVELLQKPFRKAALAGKIREALDGTGA